MFVLLCLCYIIFSYSAIFAASLLKRSVQFIYLFASALILFSLKSQNNTCTLSRPRTKLSNNCYYKICCSAALLVIRTLGCFMLQLIDMEQGELEWLSRHLGHELNIHKSAYQLHRAAVEVMKVGKVLMTIDEGCAQIYHGKNGFQTLYLLSTSTPCRHGI